MTELCIILFFFPFFISTLLRYCFQRETAANGHPTIQKGNHILLHLQLYCYCLLLVHSQPPYILNTHLCISNINSTKYILNLFSPTNHFTNIPIKLNKIFDDNNTRRVYAGITVKFRYYAINMCSGNHMVLLVVMFMNNNIKQQEFAISHNILLVGYKFH